MIALRKKNMAGFTIVEMVTVIVLLSIITLGTTQFIGQGTSIYRDAITRDNLQQLGRFAIERMSRELRNALPGSIRTGINGSVQCIEFVPIVAGSSYLQPVADAAISSLNVVDFNYNYASGDQIAIATLDAASVYSGGGTSNLTGASAAVNNQRTLTFAAKQFPQESTTGRFFIVTSPVSFCVDDVDDSLRRHSNYGIATGQAIPPAGGDLLAEHIQSVEEGGSPITLFNFNEGTAQRSAVVAMTLVFNDRGTLGIEWMRFSQEVFVRNTP